jgi:hypothetical protein
MGISLDIIIYTEYYYFIVFSHATALGKKKHAVTKIIKAEIL